LQNLLLGRVLLGGLAATGAGSLDKLGSDSKPQPTDLPAASACLDFNRAVGDVHQGVVTDLQTNGQLQKVFEQGRRAETPVARDTFYECQRARLSGDPVAFKKAAAKMMVLCHTAELRRRPRRRWSTKSLVTNVAK